MAKTIVVLGVTGTQGGSVATEFLSQGWNVKGITRNTTSATATALASQGIELISADVDKPSSFTTVFRGAHVIFAMTDFWQPFFASFAELSQKSDRATGEHAYGVEVTRGKTIVDAAAKVLEEDGTLERFIWSSLPPMKKLSGGKYTYIYHFDAKAEVADYIRDKQPKLWERTSLLNMGFYTSNMIKYGGLMGVAKDKETGGYMMKKPGKNTAFHPLVVTSDTGKFTDLLVRTAPGKNLLACNGMTDYASFIKLWSEVTGVPCEVIEVSVEDCDKAAPGGIGREAGESTACSSEFGWGQREGTLVLPWEIDPNLKLTSLREYFESEDWEAFFAK
ncbi:hypothetical protein BP5796_01617 [Coleophoma crateriformis]|uniref:NmrA-like domain-containing protein n=1 Tax=Coleophoma crateriformis TaxID=565419 RepID=A0A3D8T0Y0_9HELO|nr:hypothetical protein BP5796_01617 [Coleophoma crateriformis]